MTDGYEIYIGGGTFGPQLYSVWSMRDGKQRDHLGIHYSYDAAVEHIKRLSALGPLKFDANGNPRG